MRREKGDEEGKWKEWRQAEGEVEEGEGGKRTFLKARAQAFHIGGSFHNISEVQGI